MTKALFPLLLFFHMSVLHADDLPAIRLAASGKGIEVVCLSPKVFDALLRKPPTAEQWALIFAVRLDGKSADLPPMLGKYVVGQGTLRFEPRFPLVPGAAYRATFDFNALPGQPDVYQKPLSVVFALPKPAPMAAAVVEQVYPTANKLPENQLKFYLHFSAPMSRGDSFRHIHLLDAAGKAVESPFLEIDQELWDPEGKRFTLFIDPGRIKRGLKPREDLGPVLEEGKRYTLVIDRAWADAADQPLKETYRKIFTVALPDEKVLDVKAWKLQLPASGGRAPLTVGFPKPLDHALLHRLVWVEDDGGRRVAGTVTTGDEEKRWQFTPTEAWTTGRYRLLADTRLEDLAGNSLARPFEVDVFRPVEREVKSQTVAIPFVVKN